MADLKEEANEHKDAAVEAAQQAVATSSSSWREERIINDEDFLESIVLQPRACGARMMRVRSHENEAPLGWCETLSTQSC